MLESLLVEILTEELPPKSLSALGATFGGEIFRSLQAQEFVEPDAAEPQSFATPRRLSVVIPNVKAFANERSVMRKGPALNASLGPDGQPSAALLGFAKSCGVTVAELAKDDQRFFYESVAAGASLETGIATAIQTALTKLPIKKLMRWGIGDAQFVRPVQGLMVLHGSSVVRACFFGHDSGQTTLGHRFLSEGEIFVPHADQYETLLHSQGRVIVDFSKRRALILEQLRIKASGYAAVEDPALVDEVTALVEYPAVYLGKFNPEFLNVPPECLILSMKHHQRYFPLTDSHNNLTPNFLMVSNIDTETPDEIIQGNERVLRARLADAQFFFMQDKKIALEKRVSDLANVIHHNKLGSQLDRVTRIEALAIFIANLIGADVAETRRAAHLCKADLVTDMVGEFPELQGVIGAYYAAADGEPEGVCQAIKGHYLPRFAEDGLPETLTATSVALADKFDTLVGMHGIGLVASGDKDPFGLRRQALGVMRILDGLPQLASATLVLDLGLLINKAKELYTNAPLDDELIAKLHPFMLERFKNYLSAAYAQPDIEAVLIQMPTDIAKIRPKLLALRAFQKLPAAMSLAGAGKRIRNILKKVSVGPLNVTPTLFQQEEEHALYNRMDALQPIISDFIKHGNYEGALFELSKVADAVDHFFERVMVMTEELPVRANRIALLQRLHQMMNAVADISLLAKV